MSYPAISQTWTFSFNNRYTFVSVIGAMQTVALSLKNFLKTTMGYTVKGSCTAGTGAMDGVDRWASATDVTPRATIAAASQAWFVFTDGAGVDWLLAFQSSADDIFRLSHSPGGNYVAAGTASNQPTATDECFDVINGTWVNNTAANDRVWHMWGSADKKIFRIATYRQSALAAYIAGEKYASALVSPTTHTLAIGGGTVAVAKSYYSGTSVGFTVNATYTAATLANSDISRIHSNQDVTSLATQGGEMIGAAGSLGNSASTFISDTPVLQGSTGSLMLPLQLGSKTVNADGKLGSKFDAWFTITSSNTIPAIVDTFGSLQFVVISAGGGIILPCDGVTTPVAT